MRNFNQYFFKNKFHIFSFFFKFRILNFKRTKWLKIKNQIFYYIKQLRHLKRATFSHNKLKFLKNLFYLKKILNNNRKIILNNNRKTINYTQIKEIQIKKKSFKLKKKVKVKKKNKILVKFKLYFLYFIFQLRYFVSSKKFFKLKKKFSYSKITNKQFNSFFFKKKRNFLYKFFFFNHLVFKKRPKFTTRKRYIFKNLLVMKSTIIKYFFGYFSLKNFKKQLKACFKISTHIAKISQLFIHYESHIDILLYRLKFFTSPYFAKFARKNNLIVFKKLHLNNNDFISLNLKYNYKLNLQNFVRSFLLPSFYEVDYYTNTVYLVKNLKSLNLRDINSILKEPLCVYKFKNYLLK